MTSIPLAQRPLAAAARGHRLHAQTRRRPVGVKAVGSFLPRLTRKAFEKYGFSAASLITDWATIAGKELAAFTAPERLKWPRGVEPFRRRCRSGRQGAPRRDAGAEGRRRPARSMCSTTARQIIERINAYFGYAAIAELRILQAPVRPAPGPRAGMPRRRHAAARSEVASVADAALRDALGRPRRRASGPAADPFGRSRLALSRICLIPAKTYVICLDPVAARKSASSARRNDQDRPNVTDHPPFPSTPAADARAASCSCPPVLRPSPWRPNGACPCRPWRSARRPRLLRSPSMS